MKGQVSACEIQICENVFTIIVIINVDVNDFSGKVSFFFFMCYFILGKRPGAIARGAGNDRGSEKIIPETEEIYGIQTVHRYT